MAQDRARIEIAIEDRELALGLDGLRRSLVRRGLTSFGFAGGEGDRALRRAVPGRAAVLAGVERVRGDGLSDRGPGEGIEGRGSRGRGPGEGRRGVRSGEGGGYRGGLREVPCGLPERPSCDRGAAAVRHRKRPGRRRSARVRRRPPESRSSRWGRRNVSSSSGGSARGGRVAACRTGSWTMRFAPCCVLGRSRKSQPVTGYLTGEQSEELFVLGRAVEEREKDDTAFRQARAADTAAAYKAYLSKYPNGRHAAEAKRLLEAILAREDDAAFARAKKVDTATAYEAYLSQYPDGHHAAEAKRLRDAAHGREAAAAVEKALGLTLAERGSHRTRPRRAGRPRQAGRAVRRAVSRGLALVAGIERVCGDGLPDRQSNRRR